jgi:hypothetical protein
LLLENNLSSSRILLEKYDKPKKAKNKIVPNTIPTVYRKYGNTSDPKMNVVLII